MTSLSFWSVVILCTLCPPLSMACAYTHFEALRQCVQIGSYPHMPYRVVIVLLANPIFAGTSLYGFWTISLPVLRQMRTGEY